MHIYSHEELVQKVIEAQTEKIRLYKKNQELEKEIGHLRTKAANDFKLIEELRKQRNDFAEQLKNHEKFLY